jgi:hypothetical protein
MTLHNETVNFLVLQGWEYDANAGDGFAFRPEWYDEDALDQEWYTIEQALECERMDNPDAYREFELVNNLDSRYAHMFSQYMDQ